MSEEEAAHAVVRIKRGGKFLNSDSSGDFSLEIKDSFKTTTVNEDVLQNGGSKIVITTTMKPNNMSPKGNFRHFRNKQSNFKKSPTKAERPDYEDQIEERAKKNRGEGHKFESNRNISSDFAYPFGYNPTPKPLIPIVTEATYVNYAQYPPTSGGSISYPNANVNPTYYANSSYYPRPSYPNIINVNGLPNYLNFSLVGNVPNSVRNIYNMTQLNNMNIPQYIPPQNTNTQDGAIRFSK